MNSKIDQSVEELKILIRARYPIVYIQSDEKEMDVVKEILRICIFGTKTDGGKNKFQKKLVHWDIVNGFTTPAVVGNIVEWKSEAEGCEDPIQALNHIQNESPGEDQLFILSEFHHFLDDIQIQRRLRIFCQTVAVAQRKMIILLSPKNDGMSGSGKVVPTELENIIHLFSWPYPDSAHIRKVLVSNFIPNLNEGLEAAGFDPMKFTEESMKELVDACKGMTVAQIDNATSKSVVRFKKLVPSEIAKEKKQIIKKSGLCEYIEPDQRLSDIGGNEIFKSWLKKRKDIQSEEAYRFGCDLPRGVLLLGPWGSGKSSAAKAVINEWKIPGIRVDASKIYSMYVGQSIVGEESVILWDKKNNIFIKKQMNDHEFWENIEEKEIYVQSMDFKKHSPCWKKVKSHIIHNKKDNDLIRIKTFSGKEITVTKDHSLFSYDDSGKIIEIKGSDIFSGKQLVRPSQTEHIGIDEYNGVYLSEELCQIIGLWLGDGSISRSNGSVRYRIHSSEKEYIEIKKIIEKSGHTCSHYKDKGSKGITIFLDSSLSEKLIDLGLKGTSKTKRIPTFVYGLSFNKKALVVRGYFSADGCSLKNQIEVVSINKYLLFDFQKITDELGFSFKIRSKKRNTSFKSEHEIHRLFISDNCQCRNFNLLIGWLFGKGKEYKISTIERRSERINSFPAIENIRKEINRKIYSKNKRGLVKTKKYDRHRICAECIRNGISIQESGCDILYASYELDTVKEVDNVSIESEFVYDLSVEDTENFITESGFLVHNSEQRINAILELAESVSPCIVGNTPICIDGKIKYIEDIYNKLDSEELNMDGVCYKKINKKILSLGIDGKINDFSTKYITKRKVDDLVRIKAGGEVFECSRNHKLLCINEYGDTVWVEAQEITGNHTLIYSLPEKFDKKINKEDFIPEKAICENKEESLYYCVSQINDKCFVNNPTIRIPDIDAKLGYYIGLIASDGFCSRKYKTIGFTNTNNDLIDEFSKLTTELFGIVKYSKVINSPKKDNEYLGTNKYSVFKDTMNISFSNSIVNSYINNIFDRICFMPKVFLEGYLSGYMDGDGTIKSKDFNITFCNKSDDNKKDELKLILSRMGIFSVKDDKGVRVTSASNTKKLSKIIVDKIIHRKKRKKLREIINHAGGDSSRFNSFFAGKILSIIKRAIDDNVNVISKNIGGNFSEYKNNKRRLPKSRMSSLVKEYSINFESKDNILNDEFFFLKVESQEIIKKNCFVYDFSMEESKLMFGRNFISNNFISHNCILWWDEIENLLSGDQGPNDGGASSRVVGIISTWMAEHEGMVFNIFTANDISGRPPKLFRKGRLDEIFIVDLPVREERVEILKIHVRKRLERSGNIKSLDSIDYDLISENTYNFSGSEIEAAINSAFIECFTQGSQELTTQHVLKAVKETIPMSQTMKEEILQIRKWQEGRAIRASAFPPENIIDNALSVNHQPQKKIDILE